MQRVSFATHSRVPVRPHVDRRPTDELERISIGIWFLRTLTQIAFFGVGLPQSRPQAIPASHLVGRGLPRSSSAPHPPPKYPSVFLSRKHRPTAASVETALQVFSQVAGFLSIPLPSYCEHDGTPCARATGYHEFWPKVAPNGPHGRLYLSPASRALRQSVLS